MDVNGFGDWSDFYGFFDENIFGEALVKIGTGAASTALGTFIQGELGPAKLQSGQIFYSPYGVLPGVAPAVTAKPAAPLTTAIGTATPGVAGQSATIFEQIGQTDFTPWILAGAGALLLLAILK